MQGCIPFFSLYFANRLYLLGRLKSVCNSLPTFSLCPLGLKAWQIRRGSTSRRFPRWERRCRQCTLNVGRGGDTINGIQVTCKPEFTVSSLDSSAIIIFQRNHCLWHHFFFVLTSFFSSSFSRFPLLALPYMVFLNSKHLIQRKRRPASLIKCLVLKWTSQKKVSFKTCELPSCAFFHVNFF